MENGTPYKTFLRIIDAADEVGVHYSSIRDAVKSGGRSAGFRWEYAFDDIVIGTRQEIWTSTNLEKYTDIEVSDFGRVRKLKNGKISRIFYGSDAGNGYKTVQIYSSEEGRTINVVVHCLVALAFLGSKPDGKVVNHKNGIKKYNRLENLEYITYKENALHALAMGLVKAKKKIGITINVYDEDLNFIKQMPSKDAAKKHYGIGWRVFNRLIETGEVYNGLIFRPSNLCEIDLD